MKIVHVIWQFSVGGVENMLIDIANYQCNYADVHIVAINNVVDSCLLTKLNPKVLYYCCGRNRKSRNPIPFLKLNWYLFKINPDLIHNHFGDLYKYELGFHKKVWTIHNTGYSHEFYSHYDKVFGISKAVCDEWAGKGFPVNLVANGINCSLISHSDNRMKNNVLHFVQIGRILISQKGQDLLITALSNILNAGYSNFLMHFIGDGPDLNLLQNLVMENRLEKFVVFEGKKSRDWIYKNLCNFDLFIQPSRFEGFGLTVAEACAAKIPVLVSDIEGPMEIIDNGSTGMYFKSEDVNDLCFKIISILNDGYDKSFIDSAYRRVCSLYDVSRTAIQYIEEYKSLIS